MNKIRDYKTKKVNPANNKHIFYAIQFRDPITHKPTTKRGFTSKREAKDWYIRHVAQLKEQGFEIKKITFNEAARQWLGMKRYTVAGATYCKYESQYRNHLVNAFGSKIISDITVSDCQNLANDFSGRFTRPNKLLNTFSNVFQYALKNQWITRNPMKLINRPRESRSHKPNSFTKEEFQTFKKAVVEHYADNPKAKALLLLLGDAGMRKGEALALRWSKIDLENRVITIDHAVTRDFNNKLVSDGSTKNVYSVRDISIGKNLVEVLQEWKNYQLKELDTTFDPERLAFTNINGGVLSVAKPGKWLKTIEHEYRLPKVTVHGLRHTFTTLLISHTGNVNAVSSSLGHSNAEITMKVYNDLHPMLNSKGANYMDSL